MDPLTGAAISGGGMLLGSYLQNHADTGRLREQMQFQDRMSSTAHQREVADLRAAGLNPMLSALGAGASGAPGASMPTQNPLEGISTGVNTGMALKMQKEQIKSMEVQNKTGEADYWNKRMQSQAAAAQASSTSQDVQLKVKQNKLMEATMSSAIKKARAEGDWSEVNQLMGVIRAGTSSAADLLPSTRFLKGAGELFKGKK